MKNVPSSVQKIKEREGVESVPKYKPGKAVTRTSVVTLGLVNLIQMRKNSFIFVCLNPKK